MAEKGGLEQQNLINEYNVAGSLEIFMGGEWRRVTSKDFRSFNGPRNYSDTGSLEKGKVWDKARKISESRG
jgi:hypothetical protein